MVNCGVQVEKLLSIGKILNFHGIHGEVKVGYTPEKKEKLTELREVYTEKDSEIVKLTVESVRFHKNFALIKFKEFSSINDVLELKGAYLKIPKSQIESELDEDEFYIDDLIGLEVYDISGNRVGNVTSIINLKQEEDILAVKDQENHEHLIPFVKDLVPEVNIEANRIIVKKIPGLLDELQE